MVIWEHLIEVDLGGLEFGGLDFGGLDFGDFFGFVCQQESRASRGGTQEPRFAREGPRGPRFARSQS